MLMWVNIIPSRPDCTVQTYAYLKSTHKGNDPFDMWPFDILNEAAIYLHHLVNYTVYPEIHLLKSSVGGRLAFRPRSLWDTLIHYGST